MLANIVSAILLVTSIDINSWQHLFYPELVKKLTHPNFPTTILRKIDDKSITFVSYSAVVDPGDKYYYVMHDPTTIPTWLFLIRHDNKIKDELWHRGTHDGIPCNIFRGNKLLLHIKTVGFIKANIMFQIKAEIENTKYGVIINAEMDNSYSSEDIEEFKMVLWSFPHPTIKNLVIVVSQGYIRTSSSIDIFMNHIKWHIDNVLQNFGDRLIVVTK